MNFFIFSLLEEMAEKKVYHFLRVFGECYWWENKHYRKNNHLVFPSHEVVAEKTRSTSGIW